MSDQDDTRPPLGATGLVSRAIALFFEHLIPVLNVTLLPSILLGLLSFFLTSGSQGSGGFSVGYFLSLTSFGELVDFLISTAVTMILVGMMTLSIQDRLRGQARRLNSYFALTLAHVWPLVILGTALSVGSTIGTLLLILPGLYLMARFLPLVPVIVLEGAGWDGFGRAGELTRDYRWPIAGALVLMSLIFIVAMIVVGLALVFVTILIGPIGIILSSTIGSIVAIGLFSILDLLIYNRLIEIREGSGIENVEEVFD